MVHQIYINRDRVLANVEAENEYEALYRFATVNMNHGNRLNGEIPIIEEGHCFSYEYEGNVFSVDKLFIW